MHDLFISYAREDESWVEQFCDLLKSQGINVWKDSSIPTGKSFGRAIEDAIANSCAMIVVWSRYSVESDWVRAEATEGLRRGILMPVRRDKTIPPLRFKTIQTIDLANWRFEPEHTEFRGLLEEIRDLLESAPVETGVTATGKPPASSVPRTGRRGFLLILAGVLLAAGMATAIWYWTDENGRRELSVDLTAASIAVLDELNTRYQASATYWGYFLAKEGGQSLIEQSVLLALEAVRFDSTPQATEALRRSLVLLPRPLREIKRTKSIGKAAISADGVRLAWSQQKAIQVLQNKGEEEISQLGLDEQVADMAFLADADYLVAVGLKGTLGIWNISTNRKLLTIPGKGTNVIDFSLASGGTRAAIRQAGLVNVWELANGRQIAVIETDSLVNLSAIQSLDLSPDGRYLAFASKDQLHVWDLEKREELFRIKFDGRVSSLQFDPTGKTLSAFSVGGEAKVVTMAYGNETSYAGSPSTRLLRFAPGAEYLAQASAGRIRVSAGGDPGKSILEYAHGDNIKDIRFSQDGRLIATAGQDGMVRVWDIASVRELTRFAYREQVLAVEFSADATTLTVIARDGRIGIWPIEYSDPVVEACRGLKRNLTPDEWRRHLPDLPYRKTCPDRST